MLALDLGGSAARAEVLFKLFELIDQVAHVHHARDFGGGFGNCAHVMTRVARMGRGVR